MSPELEHALAVLFLVLRRHDDRGRAHRLAVDVLQRDLALRVRLEQRLLAGVSCVGHRLQDIVRILEWRRHQLRGLVRCIAEHDALVARALVLVAGRVDALRDVGGLAVQEHHALRFLPVKSFLRIADLFHGLARERLDELLVDLAGLAHDRLRARFVLRHAYFAGDDDRVRRHERFARDLRHRVRAEKSIDDRIGNPVAHFVGMPLRYGLACEQIIPAHYRTLPSMAWAAPGASSARDDFRSKW